MDARYGLTVLIGLALAAFATSGNDAGEPKKKQTLEEAYRQWHKGLGSKDKKEREKALRAMLPNQKDIEVLFPKHAKKLWPGLAKGNEFMIENVDQIAKEITRGGELIKVNTIDMRMERKPNEGYKRVFEIIPKDVPVYEISAQHADGGGTSASYVFLNGRWLWVQGGLDTFPEVLEKLK